MDAWTKFRRSVGAGLMRRIYVRTARNGIDAADDIYAPPQYRLGLLSGNWG